MMRLCTTVLCGCSALLSGCGAPPQVQVSERLAEKPQPTAVPGTSVSSAPATPAPAAPAATSLPAWRRADPFSGLKPDAGSVLRVGGDNDVLAERKGESWVSGTCEIETPLPEGYPAPTPPGAIDLKRYPSVRRAEVRGRITPDIATNIAFFPLFNHIKRRNIAMTSPVELDYREMRGKTEEEIPKTRPDSWTMSFLYRKPEMGSTGPDEKNNDVVVVDTAPVTVLSIGLKGSYSLGAINAGVRQLEAWLQAHPEWEAVDQDARAFYYNGPDKRGRDKWAEAQMAVRFVEKK